MLSLLLSSKPLHHTGNTARSPLTSKDQAADTLNHYPNYQTSTIPYARLHTIRCLIQIAPPLNCLLGAIGSSSVYLLATLATFLACRLQHSTHPNEIFAIQSDSNPITHHLAAKQKQQ
ncbi:hypothetical protein PtA15_18A241 [Puccinia triticina]|uniref:Uncharacterized protein n=1 Tax=Puccinia triticina TaxID=208348 RepID=A0ABY7D7Y4_9BASI|nr:uncharacterized protein PtA15_18A241 [Puccinia triticina]WAQ93183.1 hypothetical protein PtA15_18A241 [Puccinia triticina]